MVGNEEKKVDVEGIDWEELFDKSIWKPEIPGEELIGKYKSKTEKADSYGRTKYTFNGPDGDISIFGTITLNGKMKDAKIGRIIRITFTGTSPGQYQDTKHYDVKMAPEGTPDVAQIIMPEGHGGANTLASADDPEAVSMIELYEEEIKEMRGKINKETVRYRASQDPDLSAEDMDRLKKQLDVEAKKGRWD